MLWHHWGVYRLSPLPLWIADQVRNDGVVVPGCVVSRLRGNDTGWSMVSRFRGDDGEGRRNDVGVRRYTRG